MGRLNIGAAPYPDIPGCMLRVREDAVGMQGIGSGTLPARLRRKYYDSIVLALVVVTTSVAAYVNLNPLPLENGVALVVGVGTSSIIAVVVYGWSRRSEFEMKRVVDEIHKILQGQEAAERERAEKVSAKLIDILGGISAVAAQIDHYTARGRGANPARQAANKPDDAVKDIVLKSQHLSEIMPMLRDYNLDDAERVATLCIFCKSLADSKVRDDKLFRGTCSTIKSMADELIRNLDESRTTPSKVAHAAAKGSDGLSILLDRTTYPLDAVVRVRTQLDSSHGKEIKYTVTDSDAKRVHKSSIHLADSRHQKLLQEGMPVDHTIKLKGRKWKAGRQYSVTARQGSLSGTSKFSIAKRSPVIQSDKSVYLAGSDMIVTVIDPDSDKNSSEVERVGNGDGTKLTIEAGSEKINGYWLKETGKSTGIFQGIVGLLRKRTDGSVVSQTFDGERIDKTQGSGIDNGFIACKRGEEIRINYTSRSGSTAHTVFASNYAAVIELDRIAYACTDKVRIVVIAPDFNLDSDRRDAIGDDNECMLAVSTSLGKIEKFRLRETGTDTGIFEGTVMLAGFTSNKDSGAGKAPAETTSGLEGPECRMLACRHADNLDVVLTMGAGDTHTARAPIRWNIGEITFQAAVYRVGDRASIRIVDPDMASGTDAPNSISVHISSDSDRDGLDITAWESLPGNGVFDADFLVGATRTLPGSSDIKTVNGDTIRAEYVDSTLPHPYRLGDRITLTAFAQVSPDKATPASATLERAKFTEIAIKSERTGRRPIMEGDAALITISTVRVHGTDPFTAIVQVHESSGVKVDLHTAVLSVGPAGAASHTFRWVPSNSGAFRVTVYLWESLEKPTPLCPASSQTLNVVSQSPRSVDS